MKGYWKGCCWMNKPIFDFEFKDLKTSITESGLIWYWLTDSFFYLNVGEDTLFQFSDEVLKIWTKNGQPLPKDAYEKCMSYPLARLWEDMINIFPTIIESVPIEFHKLFLQPIDAITSYSEKWENYSRLKEQEIKHKKHGLPFSKPFFFDNHILNTLYIADSPTLYFWRYEEDMWLAWDSNDHFKLDEDTQQQVNVWAVKKGVYSLPFVQFMEEFESFNSRVIEEMGVRIDTILNSLELQKLYPDNYNFDYLRQDHEKRRHTLEKEINNYSSPFDWDELVEHHRQAGIVP